MQKPYYADYQKFLDDTIELAQPLANSTGKTIYIIDVDQGDERTLVAHDNPDDPQIEHFDGRIVFEVYPE